MSDVVIGDDGSPVAQPESPQEKPDPNPDNLTAREVFAILGIPFEPAKDA